MNSNTDLGDGDQMEKIVSVTEKGQATIPKEFRDALGIEAPGRVKFRETSAGRVVIEPVLSARSFRGALGTTDDHSGIEILRRDRREEKERNETEFARFLDENNGE